MNRRPPQFSTRLPAWQMRLLYTSFSLLALAGISWLILEHFIRVEGDFGSERSPWQPWALTVHGLACFAFLISIGAMLPVHVRLGLLGKRRRKSGIATGVIVLFMALTGYGLYYIADDELRGWTSTAHWVNGLITIALIGNHVWLVSRRGKPSHVVRLARRSRATPANDPTLEPELEAAE
ncbi:hypothetical protein [Aquisediminimonas sediminicola]|uniref:hypothetical protein n=1 Tax=Alteraquisediminimonas sediminicola TaxID=2676787 RepID=UPI001C8DC2FC|nr:hypothetical protein [Aquisediminimonas sediminicola]